jgi:hypothetical protein
LTYLKALMRHLRLLRAVSCNLCHGATWVIADGLTLMAKRKAKTIEDVSWPPLDWEPPPLREDELTVLEGELAKLNQLNVKPKPKFRRTSRPPR